MHKLCCVHVAQAVILVYRCYPDSGIVFSLFFKIIIVPLLLFLYFAIPYVVSKVFQKAYSSLCAFATNDDGADTL